jgi:hypothetical protein
VIVSYSHQARQQPQRVQHDRTVGIMFTLKGEWRRGGACVLLVQAVFFWQPMLNASAATYRIRLLQVHRGSCVFLVPSTWKTRNVMILKRQIRPR